MVTPWTHVPYDAGSTPALATKYIKRMPPVWRAHIDTGFDSLIWSRAGTALRLYLPILSCPAFLITIKH